MHQNLKEQVNTLAKLADDDLWKVVKELAGIFKTEMPVFEPGTDKRKYVVSVLTCVEAVCQKMTPIQALTKADEVVKYAKTQSPGLWSRVMTFIRFDNRKN